MALRNLAAEMKRYQICNRDIQALLSCSDKTVINKLSGSSEFSIYEAMKLRDSFFPSMRIEYLFAREAESPEDMVS